MLQNILFQLGFKKEQIHQFYKDYVKRVDAVLKYSNEQTSKAESLIKWTEKFHLNSRKIAEMSMENEKALETFIYPILDGRISMTHRLATIYLDEVFELRKRYYEDSLVTLEVLKVIIRYYEKKPNRDMSNYITALGLAGGFEDGFGVEDHLKKAIEYDTKVISYSHLYSKLSVVAQRRMFIAFYNRMVTQHYRENCDVEDLYRYLKEAECFYDELKNNYEGYEKNDHLQVCYSVFYLVALSLAREKHNCTPEIVEEASAGAIKMYEQYQGEHSNGDKAPVLSLLTYVLARYHRKEIDVEQALMQIQKAYFLANRKVDYSDPHFHNSEIFYYTQCYAPEIVQLIQRTEFSGEKKKRMSREIIEDVLSIYSAIPNRQRDDQTNNLMMVAYRLLLPYYDIKSEVVETILRTGIARENSTAVHTNMMSNLVVEVTKSVIRNKPHLLLGHKGYTTEEDIKAHVKDIIQFAKEAASFHDIGKIAMGEIINIQYRKLTQTEYDILKQHTSIGGDVLKKIPFLTEYEEIARKHHCDYNGKDGYPEQYLTGKNSSSIWVDIIRICDNADAATDSYSRIYKDQISFDEYVTELIQFSGTIYNPELVELFRRDETLVSTMKYLCGEGRDTMLYGIYRLI